MLPKENRDLMIEFNLRSQQQVDLSRIIKTFASERMSLNMNINYQLSQSIL